MRSTSWEISGLHEGISTFKSFLFFYIGSQREHKILSASLIEIGIPIKLANLSISNLIILFFEIFSSYYKFTWFTAA